jgi:S-ribosylhomocysteine lyase LuxS involved in autoinducer biosynthesis
MNSRVNGVHRLELYLRGVIQSRVNGVHMLGYEDYTMRMDVTGWTKRMNMNGVHRLEHYLRGLIKSRVNGVRRLSFMVRVIGHRAALQNCLLQDGIRLLP